MGDGQVERAGPAVGGEDRHGLRVLVSEPIVERDDDRPPWKRRPVPVVVDLLERHHVEPVVCQIRHLCREQRRRHVELRIRLPVVRGDDVVHQDRNGGLLARGQGAPAAAAMVRRVRLAEVRPRTAVDDIERPIVPRPQRVRAPTAAQGVLAPPGDEDVVALVAVQLIASGAAAKDVAATAAEDHIPASESADDIRSAGPGQNVGARRARDRARWCAPSAPCPQTLCPRRPSASRERRQPKLSRFASRLHPVGNRWCDAGPRPRAGVDGDALARIRQIPRSPRRTVVLTAHLKRVTVASLTLRANRAGPSPGPGRLRSA